jgi:phage/plasmid-like protein (TIGR03299 family)
MAYQGETPWHKLGTQMPAGFVSVAEALTAANLDWSVNLEPLYLGDDRLVASRRAVVRDVDAAVLGTVGTLYTPLQNVDAFAILQPACDRFGVTIESAGALGDGERVWMLAKMPTTITVGQGDDVNGYFLVTTGHGEDIGYSARFTPVRVVCQNTLNAATATGSDFVRLSHLPKIEQRVDEAAKVVESMIAAAKETGDTFAALARRDMTAAEVASYIEKVFPTPKDAKDGKASKPLATRRAQVADLVWTGVGADLAGSTANGTTAWACYNAVTEYFQHVLPATLDGDRAQAANSSALFGANLQVSLLALRAARELVAA